MIPTVFEKTSLYESDFLAWTDETSAKLRARDFDSLDLENLIEEIDSLGASQRKELLSRLTVLLEHLIKRMYIDLPQEFDGWVNTIRNQRTELEILILQSPSLKSRWHKSFDEAWRLAMKRVNKDYPSYKFPTTWQFSREIEAFLELDFWKN
ncbi:DUF29 domain-containing protein [Tumidithrix helvetica PCC 7403]|uniref:DUF29 domain-containing protein n=1 Tax=Tumidithrix helvetica TaxID=3457545 RepID=UPI003C88CC45